LGINVNKPSLTASDVDSIVGAGYKWVRIDIDWASVERRPGQYDFAHVDARLNALSGRGVRIIGILMSSYTPFGNGGSVDLPEEIDAYARFAAAAVARYRNRGVLWEIWNEPDVPMFWKGRPNPDDYVRMASAAAEAIKANHPDEWLVGPACSRIDIEFLRACFNRGLLRHLDAVTVHPPYASVAPEAFRELYTKLNVLVAQMAPAGKSIPVFCGEGGYTDQAALAMTPDLQAQYAQRQMLANLANNVPLSIWYNFSNSTDWQSNPHSNYGVTSASVAPKASYRAVRQLTESLAGYAYVSRLWLGNADDYCLVFRRGQQIKLVLWTATGQSRSARLSPLTGRYVGKSFVREVSLVATSTGLSVPLGGHPLVVTPQSDEASSILLGYWSRLPATIVIATRQDAVDGLLGAITSQAWAAAPEGTRLVVDDMPTTVDGYVRPAKRWTLTNLASLTAASPEVQQIFNELPSLRDRVQGKRRLRLTLVFPNGSSFVQEANVFHRNPVRLTVLPAVAGRMNVLVQSLTGAPINGRLVSRNAAATLSQTVTVTTLAGQQERLLSFSSFSPSIMEQGVYLTLTEVVEGSTSAQTTARTLVVKPVHFPNVATGGYTTILQGDSNIAGRLVASSVSGLAGAPPAGLPALQLDYEMGTLSSSGFKYINLIAPEAAANTWLSSPLVSVGAWVYGDGSGVQLSSVAQDETGQRHKFFGPRIDWKGWRWVSIAADLSTSEHWMGANDGIVHGRLRVTTPLVIDSCGKYVAGRLQISGVMVTTVGQ
jgi:hypothetical protein